PECSVPGPDCRNNQLDVRLPRRFRIRRSRMAVNERAEERIHHWPRLFHARGPDEGDSHEREPHDRTLTEHSTDPTHSYNRCRQARSHQRSGDEYLRGRMWVAVVYRLLA